MNFVFSCSTRNKIHFHAQACNIYYYMAELVQREKEHSDWFPSGAVRVLLYGLLRWTAHKVISLICALEKIFKRKHFGHQVETFSLLSDQKFWQTFFKNGIMIIKTNFFRLIVARMFHRSNVLCFSVHKLAKK